MKAGQPPQATIPAPKRASAATLLRVATGAAIFLFALLAALWLGRPAPQARQFPIPDPRRAPLYGVNLDWEQYADAALETALADIEALQPGCWARLRFDWEQLEPAPGQFHWERTDRLAAALRRRNLRIIAVLERSPAWARAENDRTQPNAPPREKRLFGRFLEAFIARYGDLMDAYQIWDEPNIHPQWGNRYVDAADYVGLLREGAIQVRAGDPGAWVLAGGLAPTTEASGLNQNDIDYLRAMYAAGAAPWFDALAIKAYGLRAPPDEAPAADRLNFQRAILLRSVMERADDGAKPIWGVEFGWNYLPADWAGPPSIWGQTQDETQQVAWSAAAVDLARREWPWMGPLLWATWEPAVAPLDPRWGFAMLDQSGRPRAIRDWFASLPAGPAAAPAGHHGFWEPAVTLEGSWRVANSGADIGAEGSAMTIRFVGTALDLTVRRGDYWAYLDVTIDGAPANALPRDERGRSYLVLHDPKGREATVTLARRLPAGEHTARLTAHGGWDQWALKSFTVRTEPTPGAHTWGALAAGLLAAGALAYLFRLGRQGQIQPALRLAAEYLLALALWWQSRPTTLRILALLMAGGSFILLPSGTLGLWNLAGGIIMAGLLCLWPAGGLILVAAVIPFYVRPPALLGIKVPGVEMILWLTALGWLVETALRRRSVRQTARELWAKRSWLDLSIFAFLGVATLSALTAREIVLAADEWQAVFLSSTLLYVLWRVMPTAADEHTWMWRAVDGLVAGGALIAVIGLAQRISGVGLIAAEGVLRVRAVYGSPNNLALYLERILPICLGVAAFGVQHARRRWVYALLSLPIIAALYLTYSRGAWLVGLPAALLVLGLAGGGKWRWVALGLVAALLLALLPLAGAERLASAFDLSAGTGLARLRLWQGAWNMARDYPWLGVGPDNFLDAYRTRYVLPSAWQDLNLSHPHNLFLDALTRLGALGLAAFLAMLAALASRLLWLIRHVPRRAGGELFIGLAASVAAGLAHGLIDNSFFLVDLALVFMMIAGLTARWSAAHAEGRPLARPPQLEGQAPPDKYSSLLRRR